MKLFVQATLMVLLTQSAFAAEPANCESVCSIDSAAAFPVELATLTGSIEGRGGESDIYYIQDAALGKVELEHRNAKAYEAIRASEGKKATVTGTWNESYDSKLVFIVDSLELAK